MSELVQRYVFMFDVPSTEVDADWTFRFECTLTEYGQGRGVRVDWSEPGNGLHGNFTVKSDVIHWGGKMQAWRRMLKIAESYAAAWNEFDEQGEGIHVIPEKKLSTIED